MKYMLEIVLVLALCWLGWAWNGEKQNVLAQSDQIDALNARVARLELDLDAAKESGEKAATDLEATKALLDQAGKDLQDKTDALSAKTAEAEELLAVGKALKGRVAELEGYKAKAIVAEMPKPASP
jgi:outer membrane murein-binding lipoprotein Lpp